MAPYITGGAPRGRFCRAGSLCLRTTTSRGLLFSSLFLSAPPQRADNLNQPLLCCSDALGGASRNCPSAQRCLETGLVLLTHRSFATDTTVYSCQRHGSDKTLVMIIPPPVRGSARVELHVQPITGVPSMLCSPSLSHAGFSTMRNFFQTRQSGCK